MNESAAREVLLVRAVEGADAAGRLLTEDDRRYAGRAAAELVRWKASDRGERATAEAFVAKRAELLAGKLAERSPRALHAFRAMHWRPWIGIAFPLIALVIGATAEHVADRRHVNILAFPLLGLMVWNVAVYVWLAARAAAGLASGPGRAPGWTRRVLAGAGTRLSGAASGPLAGALAAFALEWAQRSAPLVTARAARVLHLSATMLALGAMAGLYVRGLAFEYRAGWESTFLDAESVHRLLAFFLEPVSRLLGQPFPGAGEIAALRWSEGGTGENAARWIYLYTGAVMLCVIVPRLVLAMFARYREQGLSARFPLSLDEPYFRRVLSAWREAPARVRVVPYAYTPPESSSKGLRRIAVQLFGDDVQLSVARTVAFGEEDDVTETPDQEDGAPDFVVALFSLATTPETENHGVFLDALKSKVRGTLAVIVDQSPFRERLGALAGADARLEERRQAWTGLASTRDLHVVFVDLSAADPAAKQQLESLLSNGKVRP